MTGDDVYDGQPIARPDCSATETFTVSMTVEQANIVALETQEMELAETQNGDIDDIVEDCLQICEIVKYRTDPSGQVTLALTARQWKVVLAVLDHYSTGATEPGEARALRQTHRLITSQIGDALPPGRVYGL